MFFNVLEKWSAYSKREGRENFVLVYRDRVRIEYERGTPILYFGEGILLVKHVWDTGSHLFGILVVDSGTLVQESRQESLPCYHGPSRLVP